jgi:hypothetical protein
MTTMPASEAEPYLRDRLWRPYDGADETGDPAVVIAHEIAQAVMDVAGPLFWAALIVGFAAGALGIGFWP